MKPKLTLLLATIGFLVSLYLYIPYVENKPVGLCPLGSSGVSGCDVVRTSDFANLLGQPLPLWGMLFYLGMFAYTAIKAIAPDFIATLEAKLKFQPDMLGAVMGFLFSLYLTGIEAFVIHAWCLYCIIQAVVAVLIFLLYMAFSPTVWSWVYPRLVKPLFFLTNPERIHDAMTNMGRRLGLSNLFRNQFEAILGVEDERIQTTWGDRTFQTPVGLAAGFDYNGLITPITGALGFGFESVGTVTNKPCEGNASPRLGRLPKSQSLLVNKGFRNDGLDAIVSKNIVFTDAHQPGLSIGATNAPDVADTPSQIADILLAFERVKDDTRFSYLELNISCPNVVGSGNLANPEALSEVLTRIRALPIKRPLWVKFPIEIAWQEAKPLVDILVQFEVEAVVIGNLAKRRDNPRLDPEEVAAAGQGNFSGKPTWDLSNQLIQSTYRHAGDKLKIIGLGGIFSAADAYTKIRLGASMVQLITGMIFRGPSLMHDINVGLLKLLERDGYGHLSEAVGVDSKQG